MAESARAAADNAGLPWEQISSIGVGSPGTIQPESGVVSVSQNFGTCATSFEIFPSLAGKSPGLFRQADAGPPLGADRPWADMGTPTMPKLKTHSGAKKRFSLTKSGKVKRAHAFKSHLLNGHGKDTKRKRGLRAGAYADKTNEPRPAWGPCPGWLPRRTARQTLPAGPGRCRCGPSPGRGNGR